jgi:hypothetical protein
METNKATMLALLRLCLKYSAPGVLATLVISGAWHLRSTAILGWPTTHLLELANFQPSNLDDAGAPNLEQIVTGLSGSPCLHTLRLQQIAIAPGHGCSFPEISLPSLQLLNLNTTSWSELGQLIHWHAKVLRHVTK